MDGVKASMRDLLDDMKRKFNCDKITYASNRKYRHQLEVPLECADMVEKDDNFFVTTRLKNCRRFLCAELSNLTTQLCEEGSLYRARISPLIRDMFERFYASRSHWLAAVRCMAEIDALCALAEVSSQPNMCKALVREPPCKAKLDSDDEGDSDQ